MDIAKPPQKPPVELLDRYTMNGRVPISYYYFDGIPPANNFSVYKKDDIDNYIFQIKAKKYFYYGKTDLWLYKALGKYNIRNKSVAVMGSVYPIYESMCLSCGARPTTIDYNKIYSEDPRIKAITVAEYDREPVVFDAAFSISSFEHDGLGRYGDPLNPDGDIQAMRKMRTMLKPKSLLFLAVPIGRDELIWNAHRVYGRIRLPKLLDGWKILDIFGKTAFMINRWKRSLDVYNFTQPIFVLENKT